MVRSSLNRTALNLNASEAYSRPAAALGRHRVATEATMEPRMAFAGVSALPNVWRASE